MLYVRARLKEKMNINEAVEKACKEPTFLEALAWIAVWENDRAVKQAIEHEKTGVSTAGNGGNWDTLFLFCFKEVSRSWKVSVDMRVTAEAVRMGKVLYGDSITAIEQRRVRAYVEEYWPVSNDKENS